MAQNLTVPISQLSPFMGSGRQYVRARVSDKGDIRNWDKPTGKGKLFSCVLNDESCSIRATFFNEGVDNFFQSIVNGGVYVFGGMQVKSANRAYSNVNNDYECSFDGKSEVLVSNADSAQIPMQRFNFIPLSVLRNKEKNALVDILCVVKTVGEKTALQSKASGKDMIKLGVTLVDSTSAVDMTLWNDDVAQWNYPVGTVLALKNVKRSDWDQVSLTWSFSTVAQAQPNTPDAVTLQRWFAETRGDTVATLSVKASMQNEGLNFVSQGRQYLSAIERNGLGKGDKPDFMSSVVSVTKLKFDGNYCYDACTNANCNKKLTAQSDGSFRCEKCDCVLHKSNVRYLLSCEISDHVTLKWATMFDEAGAAFFGIPAGELRAKQEASADAVSMLIQSRLNLPFLARLKIKEETYQGQGGDMGGDMERQRIKLTISDLKPLLGNDLVSDNAPFKHILAEETDVMFASIAAYN